MYVYVRVTQVLCWESLGISKAHRSTKLFIIVVWYCCRSYFCNLFISYDVDVILMIWAFVAFALSFWKLLLKRLFYCLGDYFKPWCFDYIAFILMPTFGLLVVFIFFKAVLFALHLSRFIYFVQNTFYYHLLWHVYVKIFLLCMYFSLSIY